MGRPSKGPNKYLDLRTKNPNKKKNTRFSIPEITYQNFRNLLKKFKISPDLGYNIKELHNEPNEAYLFLIKQITELIKTEGHVWLYPKWVKLGTNKTIGNINEIIKYEEL